MEKFNTQKSPLEIENQEKLDLNILYAEDEPIVRNMMVSFLEERFTRVDVATNGAELLDKIRNSDVKYSCIISDNNMPKKTGLEVLAIIRADERFHETPVIILSGDLIESEVKKLKAVYIGKPPMFDVLLNKVEELALSKN